MRLAAKTAADIGAIKARNSPGTIDVTTIVQSGRAPASDIDSSYAWMRLAVALALGTVGSVGMSIVTMIASP